MTRDRGLDWARVEGILDQALDLPPGQRQAFVVSTCAGNAALQARVEDLLRSCDGRPGFLDEPALLRLVGLLRDTDNPPLVAEATLPFERLGPYRLLREIGRGGMGAVYLAERTDAEFERQVAIKLVPPSAAHGLRARFLNERQILATLDHPNIARLYDGGTAEGGTPFLVMEYIEGQRLDHYCASHRLDVAARLRLVDTVCAAVQFAHQRLVVHRDLKPGNVLVAGDGTVKLLDFGVAKLLDPAGAPADHTSTGLAFTPEYASPEQIRGEPVTTATDIYSLGVLLYELLSGTRPYSLAGHSPAEMERIVEEGGTLLPSRAVAEAGLPGIPADVVRRELRGDLDLIVSRALEREPARRYQSAQDLRDDLQRHRDRLPVRARAPTLRYRAGRFLRRRAPWVAAASLLLLTLVGGLAATAWQARVAAREARRAEAVRDFVIGLFSSADPDSTLGRTVTAKELLDRGAAGLDTGLAANPALRREMLGTVGRIYRQLGLYAEARPLLEQAVGSGIEGSADQLGDLASVLVEQGEYSAAESLAIRRVATLPPGATPAHRAGALADLGSIVSRRGRALAADSLFQQALALARGQVDSLTLARFLDGYATALWRAASYDTAARVHTLALGLRRRELGDRHTLVANSLQNLAVVQISLGHFALADSLFVACIDIRRALLGNTHPHVAIALASRGQALTELGRFDEAERVQREALEIRRAALGPGHPDVGGSLNHLGVFLYSRGRYPEAVAAFEEVLPLWQAALGPDHPDVFSVMNNLGASRRAAGDLDGAERVLRETLARRQASLGEEHPDVAQSWNNLASLLVARGANAAADSAFLQAAAIWRRTLGSDHPNVASALMDRGKFLLDNDRAAEAEPGLRDALRIRLARLDSTSALVASSRLYLAECFIALGRPDEAAPLLAASIPVLEKRWPQGSPVRVRATRVSAELARARR